MPTTLDTIHELHQAGIVVVPVRTDGSKRPALNNWKQYQTTPPGWDVVTEWFDVPESLQSGVGILTGAISGNLEMVEIEGRALERLPDIRAYAEAVGLEGLWKKATTGWVEQSPSGGLHWFYYTEGPVKGNTKLARRPATPEELEENPDEKIKVLSETRGEGGFVVTAPSDGRSHDKTDNPWVRLLGGPASAPTLSDKEVADVHRMFSIIDAMPAPAPAAPKGKTAFSATTSSSLGTFDGIAPGDDFEVKTPWADILDGWTLIYTAGDGTSYWRRPGKTVGQASATTGRADDRDRLYVFSTSTDFPTEEPITKFHAYAILHHGGDDSRAATSLRSKGFGEQPGIQAPPRKDSPEWQPPQTPAASTPTSLPNPSESSTSQRHEPAALALAPETSGTTPFTTGLPTESSAPAAAGTESVGTTEGNLATVHQIDERRTENHRSLAYSDDGNALRLIDQYINRIRYNPERKRWLVWNGIRWEWQPAGGGDACELAKDVSRSLPEGNAEDRKHKRYSLQAIGIQNMLRQAQTDARITVNTEDLDAHPWELNTPGGILDLRTGMLGPSDPTKLHTRLTLCAPDPDADPSVFLRFLAETFPGNPELIEYVQRLLGYSAVGEVLAHILPFAYGGGGNGKGVLFETVSTVLGDYADSTPEGFLMKQQFQNHSTEIAKLSGARFVICAEVNEGDKFDEAKVKSLTGGDRLSARFMRADEFTFKPTHHLWAQGNYQPKVESGGASFWRRLRLIPFLHSVPEDQIIVGLEHILSHENGPAVLHWIAQGAAKYHQGGLQEPDIVTRATREYAMSVDTVARFLDDEAIVGDIAASQSLNTSTRLVTERYNAWCVANGERALDGRAFANQLGKHGVLVGNDAPRSSSGRMYGNIGLVNHRPESAEGEDRPGWQGQGAFL